ncbi:MAG TPA: hypothetical protein VMU24_11900 [Candidatus Acidoferrales bacterium]|nr:hypothetical protein [Candidatus Acidoferrales bacterium]
MNDIDPNQEWNQQTENYRRMADEELLNLAAQESELTDIAREVLQGEMQARALKYEPLTKSATKHRDRWAVASPRFAQEEQPQTLLPEPIHLEYWRGSRRDPCDLEGTGLIEWDRTDSLEEALRVRDVLAAENIPVAFGNEMVESPEEIASYQGGVPVIIPACDRQRAEQSWAEANPKEYLEALEQAKEEQSEPAEAACCPHCRSFEIVLLSVKDSSNGEQVYRWRCDACGHKWTDDGVAQYKPLPQGETEENL